ncbi:MAG TPA: DUF4149 domain-containing protein [Candidatus Aquilonibacter sp.]
MWFSIRIVLLGLWVGAMAAFAFVFAPIAFAHIGPTPAFAATIAANVRAIVQGGNWIAVLCAAITVYARLEPRRTSALIVGCLALAVLCGAFETGIIVPQMEHTPLLTPAYDALHRESSGVYGLASLAALVAFWLCTRRRVS